MNVNPLLIEIALHYHIYTTDYRDGNFMAPAVAAAIDRLKMYGLLEDNQDKRPSDGQPMLIATRGMSVWITALCNTPFPVKGWVMP